MLLFAVKPFFVAAAIEAVPVRPFFEHYPVSMRAHSNLLLEFPAERLLMGFLLVDASLGKLPRSKIPDPLANEDLAFHVAKNGRDIGPVIHLCLEWIENISV
ncbi:MAG: hypothetical protein JWL59_1919 [Chthoniobacteraceae bacterium]|nr:hypothetical protein [Chthoniobacteraceae bacterium]